MPIREDAKRKQRYFKAIKTFSLPFRIQDSVQTYFKKRYAERFRIGFKTEY